MSEILNKPVRFYFGIQIIHSIDPDPVLTQKVRKTPTRTGNSVHELTRVDRCLLNVERNVTSRLSGIGFEVACRKHEKSDAAPLDYESDFVASIVQYFPADQICKSKAGSSGFRVMKRHLAGVKARLERTLRQALGPDYVPASISFEYAASRTFVYELYLEGDFWVKHVISQDNIRDAGGVSAAIQQFNDEICDLDWREWVAIPETTSRRPKDNIYKFGIAATKVCCFSEDQVYGEMEMLKMGAIHSDASNLGIDFRDKYISDIILSEKYGLEFDTAMGLNSISSLAYLDVYFVDSDEDVFDLIDELIEGA